MISVIIPTFNRKKYIIETIESVCNQDYEGKIEIIVVDDGSTDGTKELLEKLKLSIPFLQVITTINRGVSSARNAGMDIAKGDYIQFLDSDDLIDASKFRLQIKLLEENKDYDFCYCSVGFFKYNVLNIDKLFPGSEKKYSKVLPAFLSATQWTTHSPIYKRSACDKIGKWNPLLSRLEDWEYGCRAGLVGLTPIFCDKTLSFVREHNEERLSQCSLESTASALEMASLSIISNMNKISNIPKVWFDIMSRHLLSASRAFALTGKEKEAKECLHNASATAKSVKFKIAIWIYLNISNLFGYKRVVKFSKKILRRNMEYKYL